MSRVALTTPWPLAQASSLRWRVYATNSRARCATPETRLADCRRSSTPRGSRQYLALVQVRAPEPARRC
ncbi:hypothetical protein BN1708_020364 [Verticillium longisporum]|uniref:Uncharacterized protein n=1 Tax=Verticillium longisporum TaxID=100787 RepID=A0A0G4MU54_VERLO|nr:hypothetical protein BN1708_020364 [Verticillium longisporum]